MESHEAKLSRLKEQLKSVPALPGVYLWKDASGAVIYVGKAKQLRTRMRQYVNYQDDRAKIPLLVDVIDSFDYIVVNNEHESLVLERNLINQYAPFFNVDFKDDKSYPFIALTMGDRFPAIKYTREKHVPKTRYFGPYTNSRAARNMLDAVRRVVPICATSCAEWRRLKRLSDKDDLSAFLSTQDSMRPCFDFHVGLGPGVCCGTISEEEYRQQVNRVARFLNGQREEFVSEMSEEMELAARDLDFEKAARIKERIESIQALSDKQHAVSSRNLNADVIGIYREETITGVQVFVIREACIINSNEFILNKGFNVPDEDLLHGFLLRYYGATTQIPREIITSFVPEDALVMEAWLTEKLNDPHGAKLRFTAPKQGEKQELLSLATRNAKHVLMRYKVQTNYDDQRINEALMQLESALALNEPPLRIECFDISTIHGSYTVASMVVFTNGKADKSQYRRFKIKTPLEEANDFLCMQEVLKRRYCDERMADKKFGSKPDLIILDGGKPQLSAALSIFKELGRDDFSLAGLAKRDEELFVPWQNNGPVVLPSGSASLYLVKQIRDEAHRFAISFHRELRAKGMTASILDEVSGLGPVRKKKLMREFKSFKRLRQASLQDIIETGILPQEVAKELYLILRQYNNDKTNIGVE